MLKIKFRAMGCQIEAITGSESEHARDLLGNVPGWFQDWELVLSRFLPDSELTQLNFHPEKPVSVSETLWEVFRSALDMEKESGGLVSPALLNAMVAYGYDRPFEELVSNNRTAWLNPGISNRFAVSDITVDASTRVIFLPYGMQLDFGGIAKGWAANKAVERLSAAGPAMVNAGGDIAIKNTSTKDKKWTVGIVDPLTGKISCVTCLWAAEGSQLQGATADTGFRANLNGIISSTRALSNPPKVTCLPQLSQRQQLLKRKWQPRPP